MVDVQLENGFTRIANELLEAISGADFTSRQVRVMLALIRLTYGYGKTSDRIASSQIGKMTSIEPRNVRKTLDELERLSAIKRSPKTAGRSRSIRVVKDFEKWQTRVRLNPGQAQPGSWVTRVRANPGVGSGSTREPGSGSTHTKERKKYSKEKERRQSPPRPPVSGEAITLALLLATAILESIPKCRHAPKTRAQRETWAQELDKLHRIDEIEWADIEAVIEWLPTHEGSGDFTWGQQIQSARGFRQKFPRLHAAMIHTPKPREPQKNFEQQAEDGLKDELRRRSEQRSRDEQGGEGGTGTGHPAIDGPVQRLLDD